MISLTHDLRAGHVEEIARDPLHRKEVGSARLEHGRGAGEAGVTVTVRGSADVGEQRVQYGDHCVNGRVRVRCAVCVCVCVCKLGA